MEEGFIRKKPRRRVVVKSLNYRREAAGENRVVIFCM
jgi:hypothetical protein